MVLWECIPGCVILSRCFWQPSEGALMFPPSAASSCRGSSTGAPPLPPPPPLQLHFSPATTTTTGAAPPSPVYVTWLAPNNVKSGREAHEDAELCNDGQTTSEVGRRKGGRWPAGRRSGGGRGENRARSHRLPPVTHSSSSSYPDTLHYTGGGVCVCVCVPHHPGQGRAFVFDKRVN